jgi:hypothetical protein
MVDSLRLVHVPPWARAVALVLLVATLVTALLVTTHFVGADESLWRTSIRHGLTKSRLDPSPL